MTNTHPSLVALITGASRSLGLGFAVARRLAEMNYHVVLTGRQVEQAEELAAGLRDEGLMATALPLDLSSPKSIAALTARLDGMFDHLDVLVNNASSMPDFQNQSPLEMDLESLQNLFQTNVFGCWSLTNELLPLLSKAPAAHIVNLTSAAPLQISHPTPGPVFAPAYTLAKYALEGLTLMFGAALAETTVSVSAVDPGPVASHPERGDDENDRSAAEAAESVVYAATLTDCMVGGQVFRDVQPAAGGTR